MQSLEQWLTPLAAVLAALGVPHIARWIVERVKTSDATREQLIEILRKALDKGRVRENALAGALEIFISAVNRLENPSEELLEARDRARERLAIAYEQLGGLE